MNMRTLVNMTLPVLMLAGGSVAVASARNAAGGAKAAASIANKAAKALGKRDAARAVTLAEEAVRLAPRDAAHRALLGRSYLQAGRFASARATLEEAVGLDPGAGRAALGLALAQIAMGDWSTARRTLDAHAGVIPDADRGLAMALAGDPAGAVAFLTQVARQPGAVAKTRQNLALSLAMAGRWGMAKAVAEADLSPGDVDARMMQWAAFAQPRAASDQVAHLLGVTAVADVGRPVALALNAPAVVAPSPVLTAAADPVAPPSVVATIAPTMAPTTPRPARIVFADRREVVQALPVATIRPSSDAIKVAVPAKPQTPPVIATRPGTAPATGAFYVQLGAFESVGVARDAWGRATRRFAPFQGRTPTGAMFRTGDRVFYRLSIGGFTRADAASTCRRYQAAGGACFVRVGAGDRTAQWLRRPGVQTASR
ncbi:tetratricopeptide repeat protein [uncultured Sphingomonas sp.]|uniref:SPOR domain-containing protein n=1 Tax=uncultured Sphingomonas sp. TaxID=158754 RepID=UPI0035CB27B6